MLIYQVYGVRSGNDLVLASLIAITGKNGLALYMPLLVALQAAIISATAALVSTPFRFARLLQFLALCCAAMLTLALAWQLFGQISGMLLLVLSCVLLLSPFYRLGGISLCRFITLATLVISVFVLTYPEMVPFFGLAFL